MLPRRSSRNQNKNVQEISVKEKPKMSKISKTKHKLVSEVNSVSTKLAKQNVASKEPQKKKFKATKKDDVQEENEENDADKSIYEFSATNIDGDEVSLGGYKGHVCIIVNVASRCGHTKSNYEQLVELYEKYSEEKGLKILAFPCNQFGKQEPGDAEKIREFAAKKNVEFDMFDKINVNGKDAHPLWVFMKSKIAGPKGINIDWNFTKFIVDKEGNVVERHKPSVKPLQMVESLEKYW